jgi:hypothetical protein
MAAAKMLQWVIDQGGECHPGLMTGQFGTQPDDMEGITCGEHLEAGALVIRTPLTACGRCLQDGSPASAVGGTRDGLTLLTDSLKDMCGVVQEWTGSGIAELTLQILCSPEPLFRLYRERIQSCREDVVPELFSDAELAALQSDKVAQLVRERRSWAEHVVTSLPWAAAGMEPASFPVFIRALHAVRSHAHRVHISEAQGVTNRNYMATDDILALVPGVDLANHAFEHRPACNCDRVFIGASRCFEIRTRVPLDALTQLSFDYSDGNRSPMPSYQLLMTYGFVCAGNPNDEILIDYRSDFKECFDAAVQAEPEPEQLPPVGVDAGAVPGTHSEHKPGDFHFPLRLAVDAA